MTHLFDPRPVFLARHAQHVVLVHFPIALFLIGVLFDLVSRIKQDSRLATTAHVNLTAAAICVVPAYLTGLLAWRFALDGQRLHGLLLYHMIMASATAILILAVWWVRSRTRLQPMVAIVLELAGALSISLTAHLGGFLSGVNS
jgi:uncharacterized membrane protein